MTQFDFDGIKADYDEAMYFKKLWEEVDRCLSDEISNYVSDIKECREEGYIALAESLEKEMRLTKFEESRVYARYCSQKDLIEELMNIVVNEFPDRLCELV